jgi:hypothetical protein
MSSELTSTHSSIEALEKAILKVRPEYTLAQAVHVRDQLMSFMIDAVSNGKRIASITKNGEDIDIEVLDVVLEEIERK